MDAKISGELNPVFETFTLMTIAGEREQTTEKIKKALSEAGFDAETFCAAHMKAYEKYVDVFAGQYKRSEEFESFFGSDNQGLALMWTAMLSSGGYEVSDAEKYDAETINRELILLCSELFGGQPDSELSDEGIITFLEQTSLSAGERWKLLLFMRKPCENLKRMMTAIEENLPAFEAARNAVEPSIKKELAQYGEALLGAEDELAEVTSEVTEVYPTLAMPLSVIVCGETCYCGLLTHMLRSEKEDSGRLLRALKALGDKSRLEILFLLKQGAKNNQEVAEQMGLTPATMSHHIGVLLSCGLISAEKSGGKILYSINGEGFSQLTKALEDGFIR